MNAVLILFLLIVGFCLKRALQTVGKDGKKQWTRQGKKIVTIFLLATALSLTVLFFVVSIDVLPGIFDHFASAVWAVGKLFRNPNFEDILSIIFEMLSALFAIILLIIFLALCIFLWGKAVEFSDISWLKKCKDKLLSLFKDMGNFLERKKAARMKKILEYKPRKRVHKKNRWKFFSDRLKKLDNDDLELFKKVPVFPRALLLIVFWGSMCLAWLSYEFFSLTAFYAIVIVCVTCAIITFICNSFRKVDYIVLHYLKEEIKDLPKRIKDFFKVALNSLSWTCASVILYLILIDKPDFKQIDWIILIPRVALPFFRFFPVIYCIKIIIYSAQKIGGSRTGETLNGVSTAMMISAGYYEIFLTKPWGAIVFWIYYLLGFTASFFTIWFNVKKFPIKRKTMYRKNFLALFSRYVTIVMFTSIILELLSAFIIWGTYPGSSNISRVCSKNMGDGMENYLKSAEVFKEFMRQMEKGIEKADFASISAAFYRDPYMQKALQSFAALKENAMKGGEFTWRRYTLFDLYKWGGDSMLSISNYMYKDLPGFFKYMRKHSIEIKEFTAIFKDKVEDLKALEATLSTSQYLTYRQTMQMFLLKTRRCNSLYETLKPSWFWRMIPNIGGFHKFMLGIEANTWIFLNYIDLKKVYKDNNVVVKRSKVVCHGSSINYDKLKKKYGDIQFFPFDQKIMIYSGVGDLHF